MPSSNRAERVALITQQAEVRLRLGQAAVYRQQNGQHVVIVRGRVVVAHDFREALRLAKEARQ